MTALRQRQPREEDTAYLAYVRTLPCLICRRPGSDPAHLRTASTYYGKRLTGMAEKPDDCWALPLCRFHHAEQHSMNEMGWWARMGIPDPHAIAIALYASRPGANLPRREPRRHIVKMITRKAKSERRSIGPSTPMKSANRLPKKGQIKFRAKERQPA